MPDAGDFDTNQPFSYAAWVKLPANDGVRRDPGPHGRRPTTIRGWDLWVEGRRIGTHIINKWPENALKVVTRDQLPADQWTHVAITYDGSSKAAGVKVYVNGKPQPTNVQADSLNGTIRTDVPFKIGQRHKSSPLSGATIQDVRVYARQLADGEVASLAKSALSAVVAAPPEKRSAGRGQRAVRLVADEPGRRRIRSLSQEARRARPRAGRHSRPAARSLT